MGNLADVFAVGNKYRVLRGLSPANLTLFVSSKTTQEFVAAVSRRLNVPVEELVYTKGRGKNSRVVANILVIIYAAEYLSSDFHVEVIDTFINSKLLSWRDESGDNFKALNAEVADHASQMLGKPAHNGHFITLAKIINARIGDSVSWTTATAEQLEERNRIETAMTTVVKLGLVKDWEHLKQIAAEV